MQDCCRGAASLFPFEWGAVLGSQDKFFPAVCRFSRPNARANDSVRRDRDSGPSRLLLLAASFQVFLFIAPATADVIDISPDGARTVFAVPSIFRTEGVQPIPVSKVPAMRPAGTVAPPPNIGRLLADAASRYAISPNLLTSVAWRESRFQVNAVSPKGAVGVMQLMDGTARDLGVNRYDLSQNILGGATYLRQMIDLYGGNQALALAAYNAGPQAVARAGGIPRFPETREYVSAILGAPSPLLLVDH